MACLLPFKVLRSATVGKSRQRGVLGASPSRLRTQGSCPSPLWGATEPRSGGASGPRGPTDPGSVRSRSACLALLGDLTLCTTSDKWAGHPGLSERWARGGGEGSRPDSFSNFSRPLGCKRRRMPPRSGTVALGVRKGRPAPQRSRERAAGLPHRPHPGPSLSPTNPRACPGA